MNGYIFYEILTFRGILGDEFYGGDFTRK